MTAARDADGADGGAAPADAGSGTPAPAAPVFEKTRIVRELKHSSPLLCCRFDPSSKHVFAGAQDATISRWEIESGEKTTFTAHRSWVRSIVFHPDGETLVSAGFDGRIVWWAARAASPAPLREIQAHHGWIRGIAVSPAGDRIATCGNDRLVKLWSFADGKLEREIPPHDSNALSVAFDPSGRKLWSGDLRGKVREWDVADGKLARELDAGKLFQVDEGFKADVGGVRCMAVDSRGACLACAGWSDVSNAFAGVGSPRVIAFDLESGATVEHVSKDGVKGVAWGVAIHDQGWLVAASGGQDGGMLLFWNRGEPQEAFRFKLPNTVRDLDVDPAGSRLASAHFDGGLRILNTAAAG